MNTRYTSAYDIEQAAQRTAGTGRFVSVHQKSPNRILEGLKVKKFDNHEITLDCSAIGLGDLIVKADELRYLEPSY